MRKVRAIGVLALAALACGGGTAPAGAAAASPTPSELCQTAQALRQADLEPQARAAYARLLAVDPSSACAKDGLAQLDEQSTLDQLHQTVADIGELAGVAAFALLLAALAGWAVVCVLTHVRPLRWLPGVRYLRRVRLQLTQLDDGAAAAMGAGTTGMLRGRLAHDAANARVALASGSHDTGVLDGLADVSDEARVVVALLKLMRAGLPKRDWVVSGVLLGDSDDGAGLSLAVDNRGRFSAVGEFWATTHCGPPARAPIETYRQLTIPAAGWLGHQVTAANDPGALLSRSPESWALFTVALHWCDRGERDVARDFYERALTVDPENVAALANLGVMDGEDGRTDWALRRLERALELLER